MVGRPKTRLKKLRELNAQLKEIVVRLVIVAPRRASADTPPRDQAGLLWRQALEGVRSAYWEVDRTINALKGLSAKADEGDVTRISD